MTNYDMVKQFHDRFNIPFRSTLENYNKGDVLRIRLMAEELAEIIKAISLDDKVNLAKELADLLYVVYGTADYFEIPIDKVFAEVHRSNMTKDPARDVGGKVIKGDSYEPPKIEELLR